MVLFTNLFFMCLFSIHSWCHLFKLFSILGFQFSNLLSDMFSLIFGTILAKCFKSVKKWLRDVSPFYSSSFSMLYLYFIGYDYIPIHQFIYSLTNIYLELDTVQGAGSGGRTVNSKQDTVITKKKIIQWLNVL